MEKLDGRTKWSYTIGATGRDMAYALVSMFLLTYIQYTIKLSVAQYGVISIIVVLCLFWDAFNDPMMGVIVEKCNFKFGKYKPWILLGVLLNSAVIVILFSVRPQGWAFVAFFGVFYLLWGMTYTMNDIAYWGMMPSLSSDPKERDTLVTLMSIFICIGQFSVAGLLPTMVAGNAVVAYRTAAIVISACFIAFQLLTVIGVRERPRQSIESGEALSIKRMFKIFKRNDQLIVIGIASLMFNIANGLLISIGMNFFYFEFGYKEGGNLVFLFTVMYGLGTLLSQCAYPLFMKKLSRMQTLSVMVVLNFIGYLGLYSIGYVLPKNTILLNIFGFIIFFAQGVCNLLVIVMLNNTIEYDQYRFNERHESVISSVRSFSAKLASAMNQGIIALILITSGIYQLSQNISDLEIEAGKGLITSEEVYVKADGFIASATASQLFVLRTGMISVPIIAMIICFVLIKKKYYIDEKKYSEMVEEIKRREIK